MRQIGDARRDADGHIAGHADHVKESGGGQHRIAKAKRLHVKHAQIEQRDRFHVVLQVELLLE